MADGHDLSSSNYEDFDLQTIDFNSIKLLKDRADLVYDGNRVIWTRDFCSLVKFVENVIGLSGKWRSSGGKAKQFTNSSSDFIMTWYPGKLNSLTFNGKNGESFKKFLVDVLITNCVNKDAGCLSCASGDTLDGGKLQSNSVGQNQDLSTPDASKVFSAEVSAKLEEELVSTSDCSTLGELQDFIDQSFQKMCASTRNVSANISFAQTFDNSTPYRPQVDAKMSTIEEQFCMFKEKTESEIAVLINKLSQQTQIIDQSKHDLCKLAGENLNLKSCLDQLYRIEELERELVGEKKRTNRLETEIVSLKGKLVILEEKYLINDSNSVTKVNVTPEETVLGTVPSCDNGHLDNLGSIMQTDKLIPAISNDGKSFDSQLKEYPDKHKRYFAHDETPSNQLGDNVLLANSCLIVQADEADSARKNVMSLKGQLEEYQIKQRDKFVESKFNVQKQIGKRFRHYKMKRPGGNYPSGKLII